MSIFVRGFLHEMFAKKGRIVYSCTGDTHIYLHFENSNHDFSSLLMFSYFFVRGNYLTKIQIRHIVYLTERCHSIPRVGEREITTSRFNHQ